MDVFSGGNGCISGINLNSKTLANTAGGLDWNGGGPATSQAPPPEGCSSNQLCLHQVLKPTQRIVKVTFTGSAAFISGTYPGNHCVDSVFFTTSDDFEFGCDGFAGTTLTRQWPDPPKSITYASSPINELSSFQLTGLQDCVLRYIIVNGKNTCGGVSILDVSAING